MLDTNRSVASIVLDHSETASIFQKNRIDYCCKGHLSVNDACRERGLDVAALILDLEHAIAQRRGDAPEDPRALTTPALIAYIIDRHHSYLRRALPFVSGLAKKVARVHGDHQPSLRELETTVHELIDALEPHIEQEETVVFPAMMARDSDERAIRRDLGAIHSEHLEVGGMLQRIRSLTDEYTPTDWACGSYRALYGELEALEGDILRHVHLENHVLAPRFGIAQ